MNLIRPTALFLLLCLSFSTMLSPLLFAKQRCNEFLPEEWGYLKLTTRHKGLAVKVDGDFFGFTPVEALKLEPGLHTIQVSHPSPTTWFEQDWTSDVEISTGDTLAVEVLFDKTYSINSAPFGASVFAKDEKIGETPVFFKLNENETEYVTLTKSGYLDSTFAVGQSDQRFFEIILSSKTELSNLNLALKKPLLDKGSRNLLIAAVGMSLVSGALGIYFRNKGDDKFDEYRQFGSPERFNKSFDDAKRFDKYAGVAFVTFQASFLVSFYLFFKNVNN